MANSKISALTALTTPDGADLLSIIDDPAGTPTSKKITLSNLLLATSDIIPAADVYNNANLTIGNSSKTLLTFNSERFDNNGIHDTGSNTGRLTCQTAGKYLIIFAGYWDVNSTGYRGFYIRLNGTTDIAIDFRPSVGVSITGATISRIYDLSVSDYVEAHAIQSSGGNLDIVYSADRSPYFMMIRVGD